MLPLLKLLLMVTFLFLFAGLLDLRGRDTVRVTKVKGHADEGMVFDGRVRELDRLGNNAADEAAAFGVGGGSVLLLSMLDVICQGVVVGGILFFVICIGSSLLSLELLSIMMGSNGLVCWCIAQDEKDCSCCP